MIVAVAVAWRVTVVFTSFRGTPIGYTRAKTRVLQPGGFYDYRGAIHTHSHISHDSRGSFAQIAEAARRLDLDYVLLTDHITADSVQRGRAEAEAFNAPRKLPLFIIGAEVGPMSHAILAFPLRSDVPDRHDGVARLIADARRQDAAVFVSHMESFNAWDSEPDIDGVEIYNLHSNFKMRRRIPFVTRALLYPPGNLLASIVEVPDGNLRRWDSLLSRTRTAAVGSVDAHAAPWLLPLSGGSLGAYERLFKVVTTHVLVRELDEPSVVEALRQGRSYIAWDIWRDATGFSFTISDGNSLWVMGDEPSWRENMTIQISTTMWGSIHLLKDGKTVATKVGAELEYTPSGPGVYRVEVYRGDKLWILSNPVYLRP